MLYLVVFFSNVCDIYVCYMLNKITYLLKGVTEIALQRRHSRNEMNDLLTYIHTQ